MKSWLAALLLAAFLLPAQPLLAQQAQFDSLLRDYQAVADEADPISAGRRGDLSALRRWPDVTPSALASREQRLTEIEARLRAIDPATLSPASVLDHGLLSHELAMEVESAAFGEERIPFISGDGFFTAPDYAAINTTISNEAQAEAWLARLEALPAFYEAHVANMRRGLAEGFTQPRLTAQKAAASIEAQLSRPPEESGLLAPLRNLPEEISPDRQRALRNRALALVRDQVRPAQQQVLEFFERDYIPGTRTSVGISATPRGRTYYELMARRHTTTGLGVDEIHQLGLQEMERIRAQMNAAMRESGFTGTLPDFLTFLREDPRFYAPTIEAYAMAASEIAKRIDMEVPQLIGRLPRLPFGFRRLPPEVANTSAGYWRGDASAGRAASVLIHNERVLRFPLYQLPAWVAHEGVPGHHTQIALAQENDGISEFRRDLGVTAFSEGWGLYAERLAGEMGIYRTPYERFGQLSYEAWRASRLVIDTGIHALGWPRQRAVEYLRANTALSDLEINNEIDRYIAWPGQALAYKIGEITIRRLRDRAQAELGDEFDVRAFHDAVLANGPVTLEMLERQVEAWIATSRQDERR